MTFSYDTSLAADGDIVRFDLGDTHTNGADLAADTITALLTSEGSVGGAVIASIKFIITQLSSPNFKLDWMSVTNQEARMGFENMLKLKAQEFGISASGLLATASISLPSRADSNQSDNVYDGADA